MKKITQIVLLLFFVELGMGLVYAQEEPSLEGLSKKVSLDLRGMDIVDTIKFLATKGNLNIVVSKDVKGAITLFLNNVSISDVLDVILLTNKLACEKKKNIITIMTEAEYEAFYGEKYNDKRQLKTITLKYADAKSVESLLSSIKSNIGKVVVNEKTGTVILIDTPEKIKEMEKAAMKVDLPTIERVIPAVTEVFELAYAKAKDIEPEISKALTKGVGTIRMDERTNKLIVTDLSHNMKIIKDLITAFDAKTRQVFIEAKIVEVTLNDDFYMGVDWKRLLTRVHNLTFEGTFPFSYTGSSSLAVNIGTLATDDYEAALKLIKSIGKVEILSSPHIAVCNNEEAKFMVGSREAYVTTSTETSDVSTITSEAVKFIDVGVTLYVTPTINKDGFIKMHIKPEISSVRDWLETTEGNKIPIVDTSNVESNVLIKDGVGILIAGIVREKAEKDTSKVPLLSDMPILRRAFERRSDKKEKKELVIFLTPHIISGEENQFYAEDAKTTPHFRVGNAGYYRRKPVEKSEK